MFNLSCDFSNGINGSPRDDATGVAWLRKAAASGHYGARVNLGNRLIAGRGVDCDFLSARTLPRRGRIGRGRGRPRRALRWHHFGGQRRGVGARFPPGGAAAGRADGAAARPRRRAPLSRHGRVWAVHGARVPAGCQEAARGACACSAPGLDTDSRFLRFETPSLRLLGRAVAALLRLPRSAAPSPFAMAGLDPDGGSDVNGYALIAALERGARSTSSRPRPPRATRAGTRAPRAARSGSKRIARISAATSGPTTASWPQEPRVAGAPIMPPGIAALGA
jgi:hypothetical protein